MAEEKEMPNLEEIQEEETEVKPNIEEGLKAIIASDDINEIKAIAQSLLGGEVKEEEVEEERPELNKEEMSMQEYLGGK